VSVRRSAPHVARNREPLADVLKEVLPARGTVLEVASGTGEHAVYFAQQFPHLDWQPSDPDPAALASIEAWSSEVDLSNIRLPVFLDAASDHWPIAEAQALLCINMVHISPWEATQGLLRGAARILPPSAP
jgi:tRNA G46 methylase TrmB